MSNKSPANIVAVFLILILGISVLKSGIWKIVAIKSTDQFAQVKTNTAGSQATSSEFTKIKGK